VFLSLHRSNPLNGLKKGFASAAWERARSNMLGLRAPYRPGLGPCGEHIAKADDNAKPLGQDLDTCNFFVCYLAKKEPWRRPYE